MRRTVNIPCGHYIPGYPSRLHWKVWTPQNWTSSLLPEDRSCFEESPWAWVPVPWYGQPSAREKDMCEAGAFNIWRSTSHRVCGSREQCVPFSWWTSSVTRWNQMQLVLTSRSPLLIRNSWSPKEAVPRRNPSIARESQNLEGDDSSEEMVPQ